MTTPIDRHINVTQAMFNYMLKQGHIKKPKQLTKTMYLQCTHCDDMIHSSYSGEYVSCKCCKIGVDQTEFYTRMIGNKEDYLVVNKENSLATAKEEDK